MSLNLEGKKEVVSEVIANIAKAQTMVLAEYRGTEVVGMTKLRADARSQGVYLRVIKTRWHVVQSRALRLKLLKTRWSVR